MKNVGKEIIMKDTHLRDILYKIDRKSYPAYRDTRGRYDFDGYTLSIDHVQGDPFAAPSKVSVLVPGKRAGFPKDLWQEKCRRVALQDYLLRQFEKSIEKVSFKAKGSGKSGMMSVSHPGQEVLERSACQIEEETGAVILRMEIGFPANGRTVNSRELEKILFDFLPDCVKETLVYKALSAKQVTEWVNLASDQNYIREQLKQQKLAAFVADNSILPRESGVSGKPMKQAVPFQSPESMRVSMELPFGGTITGMGMKQGITLIVGGGYQGKSTLLKALETGVYNHIPGDGREYVITDDTAVKLRAEDGRSIRKADISMFIRNLPNGKDTKGFMTEDASGSTSQAANVVEAMEAGAEVFLIDEDTSATNFMIRDELMQKVVHREAEPIIPFIDRIEELYKNFGISTILVAGSCGSYFHKADCILQMERYEPVEITEFAKEQAKQFPLTIAPVPEQKKVEFARKVAADKSFQGDRIKIKIMGRDGISINHDTIDVRYVEQLVDTEQLAFLGYLLKYAYRNLFDGSKTMGEVVDKLYQIMEQKGMAEIGGGSYVPCNFAMVRKQEIFACINRYRKLIVR